MPPNKYRQTHLLFAQAVALATLNPIASLGRANPAVPPARTAQDLTEVSVWTSAYHRNKTRLESAW